MSSVNGPAPITVRVPAAPEPVEHGHLRLGDDAPGKRRLNVNSRWLELDGQPWLPVMGEFHFSRYPASEWRTELMKLASGGIDIVASYVFWNHHEEVQGAVRWDGQRDLRRFVELVHEVGLTFYLRPGPWVHAEARFGGLPDWLVDAGPVRCNDPHYLAQVQRFFGQIGVQLRGLLWRDGGPVIGLQIENEYDQRGPGRGAEHIAELRRIAIDAGLAVPLYTVTGWPTLDIPARDVIPVSGAYADGFWSGSTEPLPPSGVFLFGTDRAIGEMGNVGGTPAEGHIDKAHYPFFLAEAGGGMHVSYHRRPVVSADDVAATALVQFGSGANLYGYYMVHGGSNPAAQVEGASLHETQASGYPNDVPVIGYDFRAPLGQYGQVRASYGRLRALHRFIAAFGAELAPMDAVLRDDAARTADDRTRLRVAARGCADRAFLFINNHVRHHPMPGFDGVQFDVHTPTGVARVPREPVRIAPGAYFIWPIGLRLGAARLAHATVQPLTRWVETSARGEHHVLVVFALPGIAPIFSFDASTVRGIGLPPDQVERSVSTWEAKATVADDLPTVFALTDANGAQHTIVLLTQAQADGCLHARVWGRERLLICAHMLYLVDGVPTLSIPHDHPGRVQVFPCDDFDGGADHAFMTITTAALALEWPALRVELLHANPQPPERRFGPVVAWRGKATPLAPPDAAYADATRFLLQVPPDVPSGEPGTADRVLLTLDYVGDAARLYADGVLVDDHFYDGEAWSIGIDRFARAGRWPRFELAILAADPDAPIFLETAARERLRHASQPGLLGTRLQWWRCVALPQPAARC